MFSFASLATLLAPAPYRTAPLGTETELEKGFSAISVANYPSNLVKYLVFIVYLVVLGFIVRQPPTRWRPALSFEAWRGDSMRDWDSFVFNGHSEVGLMIVLVRCWLLGIASGKKTKYCMQRWRTPHSDPYNRPGPIRSGFFVST